MVELAGIVEEAHQSALLERALGNAPAHEEQQTYYMDTQHRDLDRNDVIIRVRSEGNLDYSTTVKVRPIDPSLVPSSFFKVKGFKCEIDENIDGRTAWACSLKQRIHGEFVLNALEAGKNLWSLVTPEQILFLATVRPRVSVDVPLRHFGPANCKKWVLSGSAQFREIVLEEWRVGDFALLEVSLRFEENFRESARQYIMHFMKNYGVKFSKTQMSKTTFVLEHSPVQFF
jgi:adenylate cyclase class IV